MEKHQQYDLKEYIKDNDSVGYPDKKDFESTPTVVYTAKTIDIKHFYEFNDTELINRKGQKFNRTGFSTVLSGSVYSVAVQDYLIGITSISYAASVGLPKPSLVGSGKTYIVKDEVGGANTTTITVRSAAEENIDGAGTSTIVTAYGSKEYYSDGQSWFTK